MLKRLFLFAFVVFLLSLTPGNSIADSYPQKSDFHISVTPGSSRNIGPALNGSVGACFVHVWTTVPVYMNDPVSNVTIGNDTNTHPAAVAPATQYVGYWPDPLDVTLGVRLLPGAPSPYWASLAITNGVYVYQWWINCYPASVVMGKNNKTP